MNYRINFFKLITITTKTNCMTMSRCLIDYVEPINNKLLFWFHLEIDLVQLFGIFLVELIKTFFNIFFYQYVFMPNCKLCECLLLRLLLSINYVYKN